MVDHVQIWFLLPIRGLPYTWLLYEGKEGTVQLLIEKGADINIKDSDGYVNESVLLTVY